jgi:hypothetical protein
LLHEWHEFFVLVATVAVTIIGAMFVVASIATNYLTQDSIARSRIFLSPIVTHLFAAILGCAAALVPNLSATGFVVIFGLGSVAGLLYSARIAMRVGWTGLDLDDRLFYSVVPVFAYLVMIAGLVLVVADSPLGPDMLAIALVIQLVTGMRNAWDLTLFFAVKAKGPG